MFITQTSIQWLQLFKWCLQHRIFSSQACIRSYLLINTEKEKQKSTILSQVSSFMENCKLLTYFTLFHVQSRSSSVSPISNSSQWSFVHFRLYACAAPLIVLVVLIVCFPIVIFWRWPQHLFHSLRHHCPYESVHFPPTISNSNFSTRTSDQADDYLNTRACTQTQANAHGESKQTREIKSHQQQIYKEIGINSMNQQKWSKNRYRNKMSGLHRLQWTDTEQNLHILNKKICSIHFILIVLNFVDRVLRLWKNI